MSRRSDVDLVLDMLEAARRAMDYCSGLDYDGFLSDTMTQDAVVRNIEILGEATKYLSDSIRERIPDVPWQSIAGMRDRLIHHYFGVNWDIVWSVVQDELPALAAKLAAILEDM